jgi:very-long-chain (3R)-3-hydroxyacyl-CoA dehydratase
MTTLMQVSSRLLLVWGVVDLYPDATARSAWYSSMLIAWSVTEVIRYGYFVMNLRASAGINSGGGDSTSINTTNNTAVPPFLTWLRYNTFFVLYPLGITSEVALVYKASLATPNALVRIVYWLVLAVYVPGSYVLYTHMMKQRRRVIKGKAAARTHAE